MPLEGKRIILRGLQKEDLQHQLLIRNNTDGQGIARNLPPVFTYEELEKAFNKKEFTIDHKFAAFTIIEKETNEYVGQISYTSYQPRISAEIGILIDENYWGKGYGYEAHEILLEFLFYRLGMRMIMWRTWEDNEGSWKLAQKSGYTITSRVRESIFINGKVSDLLRLQILRDEYFEKHPELQDNLPKL
ncbi:MAG: GNAT family N-acetyltransferase [Candidatus Heimdallarchaeota archaeon]|nr:GNAT family N-acetyltransferase [Candidatus Heimdallarchaeota archaeon]MDH5644732.1 GNAT family N-acetyltransferase [Candidatus Heimdallarchaeota archaeon]